MQGSYLNRNFSKAPIFDLHFHGNQELVEEAKRLGYSGVGVTHYYKDDKSEFAEFNDLTNLGIKLKKSIEIIAKNPEDMRRKVQKSRNRADILIVRGGDLKINRAACENPNVDILSQPYRKRRDVGINHVLAKKAADNNVAIEINLKNYFKTNLRYRYRILSQFRRLADLERKFKFPLTITSNASSKYHLKSPRDIASFAKCFSLTPEECYQALSTTPLGIIQTNEIRDKFIIEGVRRD